MNELDRTTAASSLSDTHGVWWGDFRFELGTWAHWRIGPLALWVGRNKHDWRIAYVRDEDPLRDGISLSMPADLQQAPVPPDAERHRVAFAQTSELLQLQPILADRPVVARPETPISIPSGERVSTYVSSAVWVGISYGSQKDRLFEVPSWRSSDTWFGDNRSGFLCYATRTTMRLNADELAAQTHRAVIPIVIDNQGADVLHIQRLSLPVPHLSVFVTPTGALWTEQLRLTRTDDAELAHVHIERDRPPMPGAKRLSEPRQVGEENLLSRVFTGLFG